MASETNGPPADPDSASSGSKDPHSRSSKTNGEPRIDKLFRACVKKEASDLHLKAGAPPRMRVGGVIRSVSSGPLSNRKIEAMCFEIMDDEAKQHYQDKGSWDFAYQLGGTDRFRINIFRQRGQTSLAARRVPREILSYEQLHLPPILEKIAERQQGLVLVSGITGSGKSTTIASMIEQINQTRACPHYHGRGPDRVPVRGQEGVYQPARGGAGRGQLPRRAEVPDA